MIVCIDNGTELCPTRNTDDCGQTRQTRAIDGTAKDRLTNGIVGGNEAGNEIPSPVKRVTVSVAGPLQIRTTNYSKHTNG